MTSEFDGPFEFQARLTQLDDALDTLHESVKQMRAREAEPIDEMSVLLFESALAEIGANVLTHGRQESSPDSPVEYTLRLDGRTAMATFTDRGPPLHNHLTRAMPDPSSESGRGLPIARQVLDELGYEREGETNTWRLVKRL